MDAATTDISECDNNNAYAFSFKKYKESFNRIISCEHETLDEHEKAIANDLYRLITWNQETLDEQKTPMISMLMNDKIIDVYDTDEYSEPKLVAKL